jgi:hypothetical protein
MSFVLYYTEQQCKISLIKIWWTYVFFNAVYECVARFFVAPSVRKIFHILIFTYVDFVLSVHIP